MHEQLLERAGRCNSFLIQNYVPLLFEKRVVGFLRKDNLHHLARYAELADIKADHVTFRSEGLRFQSQLTTAIVDLRARGVVNPWQGDQYSVSYSDKSKVLFEVDRGASVFFGVFAYGTHLNGYRVFNGRLQLLLSRRASHLKFAPSAVDTLAGGALPLGRTPTANLRQEALEETGMKASISEIAKSVGTVSYWWEQEAGVVPDTVYVFDLEITNDWTPSPVDDESGGFFYADAEDVIEMLCGTENIKSNSALVIMDFLIRHGAISADMQKYQQLVEMLHVPMSIYDYLD